MAEAWNAPVALDLRFLDRGSIWLIRPLSPRGEEWFSEHLPDDAQRFGGAVACEHRYVLDIINGAVADGLSVEFQ
jgi:hypothetical protein